MDKLSIIELERIIKNHNDGVQLCQVSLYQQLLDTMRENERLTGEIENCKRPYLERGEYSCG